MVSLEPLILAAGSFALAVVLELALLRLTQRWQLLAVPNERSSHSEPTSTAGGLAIVLIVGLWLASQIHSTFTLAVWSASLLLAFVGLWDDVAELGRSLRLALQVLAVGTVMAFIDGIAAPLMIAVLTFLILWHVNLFNFMDGIDGIAGVQVLVFTLGVLAIATQAPEWIETTLWVLTGSTAGFLAFNWPPARIFMGDVGSLFLGLILAVVAVVLWLDGAVPVESSLILLSGFWFDATYTITVRILTGQNPFESHRIHLYQKLAQRFGHRATTIGFAAHGLFWLFPLAALAAYHTDVAWIALVAALIPLLVLSVTMRAGIDA